ncbi:Lysophosphatidylcholine acyltransferase 1 [Triplophysa tibetana]|uniref:Lysophosphatidylcholine acyltransferase 1 n=1 Tax=Triplophysa tibetana TaxID=1572043 RepID=A0A5A9N1R2_9TELE|nr:Lysophosphatidylcholine acyltransferase 1 [Triplophysa tibetana]
MRLIQSPHADGEEKHELAPPFRNPFVHDLRFTTFQKLQIGLMTLTLFPIRLFVAAFMMLLAWPFAFIATIGRSESAVEPQCLWRKVVDLVLRTIMRVMWFAGGFHWISIKGRQALPAEAPILTLAPHSSYFDAIPVTMTMASIVMKAESKDIPVWGSAFIPAVPVQPVVIRYPNQLYLPIYTPSKEEKKNPALFAHNVRRLMAKALQVPVTDYSFEDCQLAMAEGQIRLPVDTCLLEFAKLVRRLGFKREKSAKLLQEYGLRAYKLQGERLSLEDFTQFLDLPVSDVLRDIFALFDEDEDGSIDIREFVIAFSVVCRPAKTMETIQLAFKMFEAEEDGAITENELICILRTALGVGDLKVGRLFRAIDEEDSGKITFESFRNFAEEYPDFAEDYLYSDNAGFGGGFSSHASTPVANGFCADFTPSDHHAPQKKLD